MVYAMLRSVYQRTAETDLTQVMVSVLPSTCHHQFFRAARQVVALSMGSDTGVDGIQSHFLAQVVRELIG